MAKAMPVLVPLEASSLASFLDNMGDQISILITILSPENTTQHFDCPGLRLQPKELEVQRMLNFLLNVQEIINNTIFSLRQQRNYLPLMSYVEKIKEKEIYVEETLSTAEILPKRFKELRSCIKIVSDESTYLKDPGHVAVFGKLLENEEEVAEMKCSNRRNYFRKYLEAKCKEKEERLKEAEEEIHGQIKIIKTKTEQDNRCYQEMQSFLHNKKLEISAELEQKLQLLDTMTAAKENKMQILRIRKEHLEEETAKMKDLIAERAVVMEEWKKLREEKKVEKEAVGVIQKWWKEQIAANPKLLETKVVKKKKIKKKKRQHKNKK